MTKQHTSLEPTHIVDDSHVSAQVPPQGQAHATKRGRRSWLQWLLAAHAAPLLLYTGLALLLTWPLAREFTRLIPGNGYDSWQNMWNMWWLKTALLEGRNPYFTPLLYYPEGASLLLHTLNPINFLISLPVHALFGLVAAYNFVILFSLAVSGYTAYLLAYDVTDDRRAALVGGAMFATSGYLLAQIVGGHTPFVAAEWIPLAVLALRKASRRPSPKLVALAGVAIAINLLSDWQYLLFVLMWAAWYALAELVAQRRVQAALPTVGAVCVALVLVMPLVVPTALYAQNVPSADSEGGPNFRLEQSADVADFFIPSQVHALWGQVAEQMQAYKAETHIQNKTAYLGYVTLLLALFGLRRRAGWFWLLSAAVFAVLALGPQLQVGGLLTGIPLPGAILYELPLVRISRYPIRFVIIASLALAMVAALGVRALLLWLQQRRPSFVLQSVVVGVLLALVVLDNLTTPFPLTGVYIPSFYAEIANDPDEYAILEAPFYYRHSPTYMLYQVVHGKPLVGGYTSRRLPYAFLDQFPLVRQLAFAEPAPDIIAQDPTEIAGSLFSFFNIRYVTLHSTGGGLRYNTLLKIAAAAAGGATPRTDTSSLVPRDARTATGLRANERTSDYESAGTVLIYQVVTPTNPVPFLGIGPGWPEPMVDADGNATRTFTGPADLLIYSANPQTVTVSIDLVSATAGSIALQANGEPLPALDVAAGQQRVVVTLDAAGTTRLTLEPSGTGDVVVQRVDLE